MENNIINTLLGHERITSTYADIYFNDNYCKHRRNLGEKNETREPEPKQLEDTLSEWISPSDLLIGKVDLIPPFTSKITRGKTHEGILAIGNEVLQKEHERFLLTLNSMLKENEESWTHILQSEKKFTINKVQKIFNNIFEQKSKIMVREIVEFYEKTLKDLETHIQSEVQNVLSCVRANIISTLNIEIPSKLSKERVKLENILQKQYKAEVEKITLYYKLLLDNELFKHNKLINYALNDRNEALQAFCRQIDAERMTACMYIMSIERKKCKIKKLLLEKLQNSELTDKLTKIKDRQNIIEKFKRREKKVSDINKEWEDKMQKLLELFSKFISFSLKLLPEQSNFLLDFQKMVVLQFNEMQKAPNLHPNILIDENSLLSVFEFQTPAIEKKVCNSEPFFLVGDLSDPVPPRYGSTETLPSNVDVPVIRVNRQYIYAKCHGYEDIKEFLRSQKCEYSEQSSSKLSGTHSSSPAIQPLPGSSSTEASSSLESLLIDDVVRLNECPARKCEHWAERNLFPFLPSYLDYSEKNFERVKAILGKLPSEVKPPVLTEEKNIAFEEIPFAETNERYRHAHTQYSRQNFEIPPYINCTCLNEQELEKVSSVGITKETNSQIVNNALTRRKASIRQMLDQNPNLLKIFTDENYDFQL